MLYAYYRKQLSLHVERLNITTLQGYPSLSPHSALNPAMPGKQVQQSTFDAIVREAIEDFGLTPDEAIADAREQLQLAGVTDFSNISTTSSSSVEDHHHQAVVLSRQLHAAFKSFDSHALVDVLTRLCSSANQSRQFAVIAGANNAVSMLSHLLQNVVQLVHQDESYENLVRVACETVVALCGTDEVNRSRFVTDAQHDGIESLIRLLALLTQKTWNTDDEKATHFNVSTFVSIAAAVASVQRQNEKIKRRMAAGDSLDHLLSIMDSSGAAILYPNMKEQQGALVSLFTKLCLIVRQMLAADDTTTSVPETFNRARVISGSKAVTESGLRPLSISSNVLQILHKVSVSTHASIDLPANTKLRVLTECIHTVRMVAVSDEICAALMTLRFHEVAFDAMKEYNNSIHLVQVCMALLRNLAGRDQCKTPIFENITVVREVAERRMLESAKVAEQYCGLCSSLCLRRTDISKRAVQSGMVDVILEAMGSHSDNSSVQRMGCLAFRNICARDEEVRRKLRDSQKAEKVIRNARKAFPVECGEVAYSALRDMDVLADEELRRDERYTMPAGFYNVKIVRSTP